MMESSRRSTDSGSRQQSDRVRRSGSPDSDSSSNESLRGTGRIAPRTFIRSKPSVDSDDETPAEAPPAAAAAATEYTSDSGDETDHSDEVSQTGRRHSDSAPASDDDDEDVEKPEADNCGQPELERDGEPPNDGNSGLADLEPDGGPSNAAEAVLVDDANDGLEQHHLEPSELGNDEAASKDGQAIGESTEKIASSKDEERIVVERNGKFLFMKVSELTPAEKELYVVSEPPVAPRKKVVRSKLASASESAVVGKAGVTSSRIERSSKPVSVSVTSLRSPEANQQVPASRGVRIPAYVTPKASQQSQRLTSLPAVKSSTTMTRVSSIGDGPAHRPSLQLLPSYRSPYAMSPDDRQELARLHAERKLQERAELQRKQNEEDEKHRRSVDAFEAWLANKQLADKSRQTTGSNFSNETQKKNSHDSAENAAAFKAWLRMKKYQSQANERKLMKERQRILKKLYSSPLNEGTRLSSRRPVERSCCCLRLNYTRPCRCEMSGHKAAAAADGGGAGDVDDYIIREYRKPSSRHACVDSD